MSKLSDALDELEDVIKDMHSIDELRAYIRGVRDGKIAIYTPGPEGNPITVEIPEDHPRTVTNKGKYHKWTDEEIQYLEANMGAMTVAEIADYLGMEKKKVASKINNIRYAGNKKRYKRGHRDLETEEKIFEDYVRGDHKLGGDFRKFVNEKYHLDLALRTVMGIIGDRKKAREGHTCMECPKLETKNDKPWCEVRKSKVHPDQPICKEMMGEI